MYPKAKRQSMFGQLTKTSTSDLILMDLESIFIKLPASRHLDVNLTAT